MIKKILACLMLVLSVFVCYSCAKAGTNINNNGSLTEQLQFLKSDLKLTQDQVLSQIKAEHLRKNNGYVDSDEVIILVELEDDALIDSYNDKYSNSMKTVAQYAESVKGRKQLAQIKDSQEILIRKLKEKGLITSVEYTYSTIINAVAVKTTYGNFQKINSLTTTELTSVSSTILTDTYNMPQSTSTEISAIENVVDVYETGIFNSSSVEYTGEGTAVAVLDSGFDCSHSVFSQIPSNQMINRYDITSILDKTNAAKTTSNLELSDVYYSGKIPFVYDYADKDSDVFPYDSEHGTHVAGVIGGNDDVITGVAINTQLVLLKVFPDLNDGANTSDILAALEDAVLLEVDAINMSLGSSCGFAREEDGNAINAVYDRLNESGISVLAAASNNYSSGFGGEQGNTNLVTNPDSATVGSPSTYAAALSVASISGVKSKYILGNNSQVFFFKESNSITGDPNDFFAGLGIQKGETKTYDYVTIPGVGLRVNFASVGDLTGKIALVRRGDNTFEEKALNAKNAGAAGCIIYNNIEGDILMSMGKTDHIPTISISKDDGIILASQETGKLTISYDYQAGPFMSDFSSWGPTPSLGLKPEITAHGGDITSSVPGGGYDQLSGTSMATPNLCGIVVLIRQYLKELYPDCSSKEISVLANQLLMSTATIVRNEQGNPYSPRKQGAGLASLYNAVNTNAYLTVNDSDRAKLELLDDPKRTGIYTMEFNVVNTSNKVLNYDLSVVGMTESVSTSDEKYVAERSQLLDGTPNIQVISGGQLAGNRLTVNANQTAEIKIVYTLTDGDKKLIDSLFPYGMYVEGFVKLTAVDDSNEETIEVDLNIPFLAFYGDWTQAPIFDKTYYEVESEAHDGSIDEEDKLKADYYATTPYGSYFYNYIIPLGTYLYDIDTTKYDMIPASEDHIAISNILGTIDGISSIYGGVLRNVKTMTYTIVDKVTGEVVYSLTDYNGNKAHSYGSSPIPYYENLRLRSGELGLVNNRQYEFKITGKLDYGDGGVSTNMRNTFSFDFYMDDEAPVLNDVQYEKVYDTSLKKDRYYITMTVYDNQYVQSITPILFTSSSTYTFLSENPIPVYSQRGQNNVVRFEITDYLDDIYADALITSALAFSIDDYALNSNIYLCQLPGTKGEFKFTEDGKFESSEKLTISIYEGEVVDLTQYLATNDLTVDKDKDYLKHLSWSSSNTKIATVKEGLVVGKVAGRTTITVEEAMDLKKTSILVNVRKRPANQALSLSSNVDDVPIESIRFSYFNTIFAYARSAQTSEIGKTGDRNFLNSISNLSFYPGERIKLFYDFDPWYVEDKYELTYASSNPNVAAVDQDGVVTGLKEGTTNITLRVSGSNLMARVRITIKSEFVIENRTLIAYKGLGGEVVIPDDEGILYIGAYAFCLYDTDTTVELPEDDFDANKIPSTNTTVTSVIIPDGVEEIQKYAFYNCEGLKSVSIPKTVKFIREFAFCNDKKLETIDLSNVQLAGREAFSGCNSLENVDLSKMYALGIRAFQNCTSLKTANLSTLRNSGAEVFKGCTSLESVTLTENTKLSSAMFVRSGLKSVDIYEKIQIPNYCFAQCNELVTVNIYNSLESIGTGAFSECSKLTDFNLIGNVLSIGSEAFYGSSALETFTLPNCEVTLGNYSFYQCSNLTTITLGANTLIVGIQGSVFEDTNLSEFVVNAANPYYDVAESFLLSNDGKTIIFAATGKDYNDLTIDSKYDAIADGAFAGANISSLTITNKDLIIGKYAFANCTNLVTVNFPAETGVVIGEHAFNSTTSLKNVNNLKYITDVKEYAFAFSGLEVAEVGSNATYGEGAFFRSYIQEVTIGANTNLGLGAFQNCLDLTTVNMPEEGNVNFGIACFANDASLSTIDLSKTGSRIESQTFYGCSSLQVANLVNAKYIGTYAFGDCSALSYVNFPIVEEINEGAFGRYSETGGAPTITEISLPNTLTILGDGVFLGCQGLQEVVLPSSLTSIGDYLFTYCVNLKEVELAENISKVGLYWFAGCESLTKINLENVEIIDNYAFTSCVSLENVDLSKVTSIGEGSFASTAVTGNIVANDLVKVADFGFQGTDIISFTAPKLASIGWASFQNNSNLTEFVLSKDLKFIDVLAFYGCSSLTSFSYLDGTTKQITGKINEYALLDNGVLYTTLPSNHLELKAVPGGMNIDKLEVLEDTYRIDTYAGNANTYITKIVLPDSLKIIGNYAFYKYDNLTEVEFKSVIAPALEDSYNKDAKLSETDPGYAILHAYFELFGLELYYCTFIDLVGKKEPIQMILPSNSNISGYDSIVYKVYFGDVIDAKRSDYEAMSQAMIEFVEYANKISNITNITLSDETLIIDAVTAYNSVEQDPTKYGYTQAEWDEMVKTVQDARDTLRAIKFSNASDTVKNLQVEINNLPTVFDITKLSILQDMASKLSALTFEDRSILDLTTYNTLVASYNDYLQQLNIEVTPIEQAISKTMIFTVLATTALASLALTIVLKKRVQG